jgi:hypothetical protein
MSSGPTTSGRGRKRGDGARAALYWLLKKRPKTPPRRFEVNPEGLSRPFDGVRRWPGSTIYRELVAEDDE